MVPFYVNPNRYYGAKEHKEIYRLILKGFRNEVKKGMGPWFPERKADRLSAEGREFMVKLMEKDTAKRLTAKEALQHPWLKAAKPKKPAKPDPKPAAAPKAQPDDEKAPDMNVFAVEDLANFATGKDFKYAA